MSDRTERYWRRHVWEGVAIVTSILLAFAIEAAWDESKERAEETKVLVALRSDFEESLRAVDVTLEYYREDRAAVAHAMAATREEIFAMTPTEASAVVLGFANPVTFDPEMATIKAMVSTGSIGLLRDSELRRQVSQFESWMEDVQEDVMYVQDFSKLIWQREAKLGGPWFNPEVETGQLGRMGELPFIPAATAVDLQRLLDDQELVGLARQNQINAAYYVTELEIIREIIVSILDILPAPEDR